MEAVALIIGIVAGIIAILTAAIRGGAWLRERRRERRAFSASPAHLPNRPRAVGDLLGTALQEAHQLLDSNADMTAAVAWGQSKTAMIDAAFGLGEAHLFGTNVEGTGETEENRVYLRSRIERLADLIKRLPQLEVREGFEADQWSLQAELQEPVADEIAEILDEAKQIRGDVFTEVDSGAYDTWVTKAKLFIETVLGKTERQRLLRIGDATHSRNEMMDRCICALEDLRDRPDEWQIRVNRGQLDQAIRERRKYDPGSQIVVAGTRVEFFARQPPHSDAMTEVTRTSLRPLLARGRELRGLLDAAQPENHFDVRKDIASWRQEVCEALVKDDPGLADWFVDETDPEIGGTLLIDVAISYIGGKEHLRLIAYMDQRIGKLEQIIAAE
jgi:hypothetical protein